jgi:hypothetical protein
VEYEFPQVISLFPGTVPSRLRFHPGVSFPWAALKNEPDFGELQPVQNIWPGFVEGIGFIMTLSPF